MDPWFWLQVVSRIAHVLTAVALLGGSLFSLCVLLPSAKGLDESAHRHLAEGVARRWKWIVHLAIALLLVSGFYNYMLALSVHRGDSLYHALLGTKMLLALGTLFLAAALVGRSPGLQGIRDARQRWTAIAVLLACIVVAISGFVKVRGTPSTPQPRPADPVVLPLGGTLEPK